MAAGVAGHLVGKTTYSAKSACVLSTINLQIALDLDIYMIILHGSEPGVWTVVFIRLVADHILGFGVPFFSLSALYKVQNGMCYLEFHWGWLLFGLLWPSLWTLGIIGFIMTTRSSKSHDLIRITELHSIPTLYQAASDLKFIIEAADRNTSAVEGKWKFGIRRINTPKMHLGFVGEEECVSIRELFNSPRH